MDDFPEFMRAAANRIATQGQATPGVEGYVFDGADGSQMAFWKCHQTAVSVAHAHEYDECMIVVQGCYTLIIDGQRIALRAGKEYFIPRPGQERFTPLADAGRTEFGGNFAF